MNCRYCANELPEQSEYCRRCGQPTMKPGAAVAAALPVGGFTMDVRASAARRSGRDAEQETKRSASRAKIDPEAIASPVTARRERTATEASVASGGRTARRAGARRQPSTYVLWGLVTLIFLILFYVFYTVALAGPPDLGVRYTERDYQLALAKTGLTFSFPGMTTEETEEFLEENRNRKLRLEDYDISYSGFTLRSFEMTPTEATAFANEFLPMFSLFSEVQLAVPASGRLRASFRVDVEKLRQELLPELIGSTQPAFLGRLLPRSLNLQFEGAAFRIQNNRMTQEDELDVVRLGAVSLRPFIGHTDQGLRDLYTSYAERIYRNVARLRIQTFRVNARRNFEFVGLLPSRVTIRRR